MEINVLNKTKNELDVEIPSLTWIEILRVYLNKGSDVTFAAWKREHFTKSPVLRIKTKSKDVKKAFDEAISAITKDLEVLEVDFKKLK